MMLLVALFASLCVFNTHGATPLKNRIYTSLEGNSGVNSCTRLLSADKVIGCSSPMKGAIGIVFHISSPTELSNFASASRDSYVALISQDMLADNTTWTTLAGFDKLKGALVYSKNGTARVPWSPDDRIPNKDNGLEGSTTEWNVVGGGYGPDGKEGLHSQDIGDKPIFYLSPSDADALLQRLDDNNQLFEVNPPFPLVSADLESFMWAAGDAETCLRRQYCDPLKSHNIYGTIKEYNLTQEVIMVTAQMDSSSLFHDQSFGANADASGMIALLAAAKLLGLDENAGIRNESNKNILFMLFNGESFGYIGSSKVAYQMKRRPTSNFPNADYPLSFDDVPYLIELGQLLSGNDDINTFVHNSNADTAEINSVLTAAAAEVGGPIGVVEQPGELPPASLRAILNAFRNETKMNNFGGVFLSDHDNTQFTNNYYASRLDDSENIGSSSNETVEKLCRISSTVARTLWSLSTGEDASASTMAVTDADCDYIRELLYCVTVDQTCDLVRDSIVTTAAGTGPMSRYVGVNRFVGSVTRTVGFFFNQLAANLAVAKNISYTTDNPCSSTGRAPYYQKVKWTGNGVCYETAAFTHVAFSPAFESYYKLKPLGPAVVDGGRDPRWSTWTESTWDDIQGRIFLADAPESQIATAVGGFIYFIVVMAITYLLSNFMTYESHLLTDE
eukprot:m.67021 g.67021  ORF g.67021 m.67021 type:complete len:675 (-) comp11564_c0_seq1:30-2054(-)